MSRFAEALREAAAVLNGGTVSPSEWLHIVRQCDLLLAGTDQPIRTAVALGPLVVSRPVRNRRSTLARMGLDQDPRLAVSPREGQELRTVALYVTHAAAREAAGPGKLLLAGIERSMLGETPPAKSFEAALRGWNHALAASAGVLDPAAALVVSKTQHGLLSGGVSLLQRLEVTDGVGHERLVAAVDANRQAWERAYVVWRELVPRNSRSISDLQPAITALQLAAKEVTDTDRLQGLLATGFGGTLTAALAVTPIEMRSDSVLVAAALALVPRSDLATTVRPLEALPEPAVAASSVTMGPAVVFTADTSTAVARAPVRVAAGVEWIDFKDVDRVVELSRQRCAGMLAEDALAGVEEAVALAKGITDDELRELVERGLEARETLVAHMLPMVRNLSWKLARDDPDEFVSVVSEQLPALVDRWNPAESRLSTLVHHGARYAWSNEIRRPSRGREVVSDEMVLGMETRVIGTPVESPEDVVITAAESASVRGVIDQLPPRLQRVASRRLGITGPPAYLAVVGAEIGRSRSVAHRDEVDAYRLLRQHYAASQMDPEPATGVSLRQLAQALSPQRESSVSRLEQRKWGQAGPGPRPPSR